MRKIKVKHPWSTPQRRRLREDGWIILKEPPRGKPFFCIVTLRWTKKDAIWAFMDLGNGKHMDMSWGEARKLYRVRAVKVLLSELR